MPKMRCPLVWSAPWPDTVPERKRVLHSNSLPAKPLLLLLGTKSICGHFYFDSNVSIAVFQNVKRKPLEFALYMHIAKLSSNETFQAVDGVLHVGYLLILGSHAKNAIFARKCHIRTEKNKLIG